MPIDSLDTLIAEVKIRHPYPEILEAIKKFRSIENMNYEKILITSSIISKLAAILLDEKIERLHSTPDRIFTDINYISRKLCNLYYKLPENDIFNDDEYKPPKLVEVPIKIPLPEVTMNIDRMESLIRRKFKSGILYWKVLLDNDCKLAKERCLTPVFDESRKLNDIFNNDYNVPKLSAGMRMVVDRIDETNDERLITLLNDGVNEVFEFDLKKLYVYLNKVSSARTTETIENSSNSPS